MLLMQVAPAPMALSIAEALANLLHGVEAPCVTLRLGTCIGMDRSKIKQPVVVPEQFSPSIPVGCYHSLQQALTRLWRVLTMQPMTDYPVWWTTMREVHCMTGAQSRQVYNTETRKWSRHYHIEGRNTLTVINPKRRFDYCFVVEQQRELPLAPCTADTPTQVRCVELYRYSQWDIVITVFPDRGGEAPPVVHVELRINTQGIHPRSRLIHHLSCSLQLADQLQTVLSQYQTETLDSNAVPTTE